MTKETVTKVRELVSEQVKLGFKLDEIKKNIVKELGIEYTDERVRQLIREVNKQQEAIKELNDELDYKGYSFEGEDIVFYKKEPTGATKRFAIPIEVCKNIWYDFSKYGGNLSGEATRKKYGINNESYQLIKSRLGLYKDSDATASWYLEYMESKGDNIEEEIEDVNYKAIKDKYRKPILDNYFKQLESEYKRAVGTLYNIENFLEELRKYLVNYKPIQTKFERKEINNNDTLDIALTDIHIGKQGTDEIIGRINAIYNQILNSPEKNINIFCLGDLAEILVQGGRHPGQIENMEGPFGFDLMMKVVGILETFLIGLWEEGKEVKFIGIGGNHGALSTAKGGDLNYTGETIIYELIKRGLQNTNIQIDYLRGTWHKYETESFHYILNHGANGGTEKNIKDILWEFGDNTKHNIILQGDKHHTNLKDVSSNATRVIVPGLAGRGEYDTRLGISSYPGYIMIKRNEFGLPDTMIKRLP